MATIPATASRVVAVARRHVGETESPPGSNRTRWSKAYGLNGQPWCGIHVWGCFREAGGVDLRRIGIPNPASCNSFVASARKLKWPRIDPSQARPGDIVFFDFGVTGKGDPKDDADHVGIAVERAAPPLVTCVEGNTSQGADGSQANGDGVHERRRPARLVHSIWRPPYKATALRAELRPGSRGGLVWDVQGLAGLQGRDGVDGIYGPATRRAVQVWQERKRLARTGKFGQVEAAAAGWRWKP